MASTNELYPNSETMLFGDKSMSKNETVTIQYDSEKHVCSTCKEKIVDISRDLIMNDIDGGARLLCFHFFYPCWDMDLLRQQYPNLRIHRVGFSFPENIIISESFIKKMQKNQEFWI